MRIKLVFSCEKNIILPIGFNEAIQGLIYRLINDKWLHNEGFVFDKYKFKMFVFSEILEKGHFNKEANYFVFPPKISIIVSSPVDWILQDLAKNALFSKVLNLHKNKIILKEVAVLPKRQFTGNCVIVKTLSPIEVHTTFMKNGIKKTHYYSAYDNEFSILINENLNKKWSSLYKKNCPYELQIIPIGKNKEKIVRFGMNGKSIIIKGWVGFLKLQSQNEFIRFAIDAGLGSRNSQGFGMVEFVRENDENNK
ncbi:CRISPR-associated endoribonuclease Cas6 [Deferribacterales bacterium Es71-Z0220]|uniref:CRISPR-associated endoribonuclease Cas6 n=1 Tax=Deferrivibrio essentukiensis TaxID=2880922 RepID=UPI001F623BBD|nr:CRISPR-associated endoribonuclease Cas6 [Deferrivibrio essentukiensis]MCB4205480.1 CRISPR-associated endoribonuclease Cas6 [Deferrivibrio essentukiensis]